MAFVDIEIRSQPAPVGSGNVLTGYAALFNSPSIIGGDFTELIAPGAFGKSLARNDVVALVGHDAGRVLGRTSSGTLQLVEDKQGLRFTLDVDPTTPDGQTALGTVRRQDVKGCSFGFRVLAEAWRETAGLSERTLLEIDIFEITLTAFPAYPDSSVALRALNAHRSDAAIRARMRMETAMRLRGIK